MGIGGGVGGWMKWSRGDFQGHLSKQKQKRLLEGWCMPKYKRAHGLHISAVGFYFACNKGGWGGGDVWGWEEGKQGVWDRGKGGMGRTRHCVTSEQRLKEAGSLPQVWLYFPPHVLRLRAPSYTLYKTGTAGGGITSGTVCGSVCMNLYTCTCAHVLTVINVPSSPYCFPFRITLV